MLSQLVIDGSRSTKDRKAVASTIYMSRTAVLRGLTERQAIRPYKGEGASGSQFTGCRDAVCRQESPRGIMKFVIDAQTDRFWAPSCWSSGHVGY